MPDLALVAWVGLSFWLTTQVQGVWLSRPDCQPTEHTSPFPPGWDPCAGTDAHRQLIDNAYTGWSGEARIDWPDQQLVLTMCEPSILSRGQNDGMCLLYHSSNISAFCFEPVTHPIDAFHMPGLPGLKVLHKGESLTLRLEWRFAEVASTV